MICTAANLVAGIRRAGVRGSPVMTAPRRIGSKESATRAALLDAALRLMLQEGYAAVTSRRVAAEADLKPQLVHYYFRTMDDLFLALVRRGAEQNSERLTEVLASPQPLRGLWDFNVDPVGTRLTQEVMALANHRQSIREELATYATDFRRRQVEAVARAVEAKQLGISAEAIVVLITSVAQILVIEESMGLTAGHAEMQALVEETLTRYEGPAEG
jgi:AcrR family transcriptional regulator